MSIFSASTGVTSGISGLKLDSSKGVAYFSFNPSNPSIVYNSASSGAAWSVALTLTPSGNTISINSIDISGTNALLSGGTTVSGVTTGFLYNSTNSGASWSLNADPNLILTSIFNTTRVAISGNNAVIAVNYSSGTRSVFYSTNAGSTWTASTISGGAVPETIKQIVISGNNAIFITSQFYLYNSTNGGQTWTQILNNSGPAVTINSVSISGSNAIIGEQNNIRTSNNAGATWNSFSTTSVNIQSVSISGNNAVALGNNSGASETKLYNSNNVNLGASVTWNNILTISSAGISGNLSSSGNNAVASILSGGLSTLYTSGNIQNGATTTWQTQPGTITALNLISASGNNAIVGTANSTIYYTSSPLCYEKNTFILVLENDEEVYKKVCELKVGDLVKTYKQGYKKIKIIKSFKYKVFNKENDLNYLYRMKENGIILTGGHSILVDEFSEEEENLDKKYGFTQNIEDKKLLLACISNRFEKIDDDKEYELYHFSLENDDRLRHYGVYINDGILSESSSEESITKL
jgi:photosystem II stability/assembly factor-like uncharacterized protein